MWVVVNFRCSCLPPIAVDYFVVADVHSGLGSPRDVGVASGSCIAVSCVAFVLWMLLSPTPCRGSLCGAQHICASLSWFRQLSTFVTHGAMCSAVCVLLMMCSGQRGSPRVPPKAAWTSG
jgi:hypothetical protein